MGNKPGWSLFVAIVVTASWPAAAQERVDVMLHNGKVFVADELLSTYSAIAVRDGKIVAYKVNLKVTFVLDEAV